MNDYEPISITTIWFLLRRTLQRSVILVITFEVQDRWRPVILCEFAE